MFVNEWRSPYEHSFYQIQRINPKDNYGFLKDNYVTLTSVKSGGKQWKIKMWIDRQGVFRGSSNQFICNKLV